jgi:glyoxylase-like metal-dependent hydrolase (beta-lactamase superfamily II)
MLKLTSLLGNSQRLDGGAMFGNAPRAVWSQWAEPDEQGRIALACRAFLVEDGGRRILLEAGIGSFFEPRLRERYGVVEAQHRLLESLAAIGLSDSDIDVVVLSHLHFDHAGGLFAAYREGRPPELLFPRARFVVSRAALERARAPHARDRASFIPELPELLDRSGRLDVLGDADGPRVLGERIRVRQTHGHTVGLLHAIVVGERGSAFFCSDLVPGSAWVHLPITMGYDRYPELLIDEKRDIFAELQRAGTHLLFTHDPAVAAATLARDERGRYSTALRSAEFRGWDLDATSSPEAT